MLDLLVRGGTLIDGTGAPRATGDVGIRGGRIVSIGRASEPARRTIDADGLWVTPGWVDVHTHYDGQVTWDPMLSPSCWHGVTTVVMGNCGVGFAPVRPGSHEYLIELMEGVEDIPGTALAEGIRWEWESFPEYLLLHWGRDRTRGAKLPVEQLGKRQTADTAALVGLLDRGTLAVGRKADVNPIDPDALALAHPRIAYDLPAGGKRLVQRARGYRATLVAGEGVLENSRPTGALPGKRVRGPQE